MSQSLMIHRPGWARRAAPGHQGQGRRSATPEDKGAGKGLRAIPGGAPLFSIILSMVGYLPPCLEDAFLNKYLKVDHVNRTRK